MNEIQTIPAIAFDRDDFTLTVQEFDVGRINDFPQKMQAITAEAVSRGYRVDHWYEMDSMNYCWRFRREPTSSLP